MPSGTSKSRNQLASSRNVKLQNQNRFLHQTYDQLDFKSSLPEKVPSNEEYERKQQFGSKYRLINNLAICSIEI